MTVEAGTQTHNEILDTANAIADILDEASSHTVVFNALSVALAASIVRLSSGILEEEGEVIDYDTVLVALDKFGKELIVTTNHLIDEATKQGVKILISENTKIAVPENKIIIAK